MVKRLLWEKFIVFIIAMLGLTVVIINNAIEIGQRVFTPKPNYYLISSVGATFFLVVIYTFNNKKFFKI